jgi:hypothetical protein
VRAQVRPVIGMGIDSPVVLVLYAGSLLFLYAERS